MLVQQLKKLLARRQSCWPDILIQSKIPQKSTGLSGQQLEKSDGPTRKLLASGQREFRTLLDMLVQIIPKKFFKQKSVTSKYILSHIMSFVVCIKE